MKLTERRKQFLQQLIDLYYRTQLPVHYEALAKAIGVSKWTAYDMLMELEKLGLLTRNYSISRGEVGRSQIVFLPTQKAYELFQQNCVTPTLLADWLKIRNRILELVNSSSNSPKEAIQEIIHEIANVQTQISFCAHIVGLFLVYFRNLTKSSIVLIKHFINTVSDPEIRLTVFVSCVLGTMIQTTHSELSVEVVKLIESFWVKLNTLPENEKVLLSQFMDETLD
ncbi:LexA family protein [Alicyclobacillus shizuokensis]|uniref:LexA family protein n=1 Tax=Alicyclobacillus shizuokensis TaxID=392014 RepID=UPI000835C1A4|nr:DNA-binding protein [Alicyclobacillus shizuokensis]